MEIEIVKKVSRKPKMGKPLGRLTKLKLLGNVNKHMKASGVHPSVMKHLRASGFFDNLWGNIKKAVEKVAPLVKTGIKAYQGYKKDGKVGALKAVLGEGRKRKKSKKHSNKASKRVAFQLGGKKVSKKKAGKRSLPPALKEWNKKVSEYQKKHKCSRKEAMIACKK